MRLDALLVDKYGVESRNKAQRLIRDNKVLVNNYAINKPAYVCKSNDKIKIISGASYVSVGASKLLTAIKH
jgi:23S rRNA (cytidine1920-2'-O)/16S rRNA (cytidine1409-2'-O)-methyltransferase